MDSEFERLDAEAGRRKTWFTFSILHVIRGTTAIWGKGAKDSVPRRLINLYSETLDKLIEGETVIEGYRFEAVIRSRVRSYKVTRIADDQMSSVQTQ